MPASPKKSANKPLLSQMGRIAREEIDQIMNERDGKLSLREFLEKHWDLVAPWRPLDDRQIEEHLQKMRRQTSWDNPDCSPEQIDIAIRLSQIPFLLKDWAIARRFALDDPGELVRGLAILNRFDQISESGPHWDRGERVLDVCASGDIEHARRLVDGRSCWDRAVIEPRDVRMDVVFALLQGNSDAVSRLVTHSASRKKTEVRPWLEGIYIALRGASENRADEVARGLQMHMIGTQKTREKPELEGAINLDAHGLYRLLRWVNADLVSQFDAGQPFPWDAAFHDWVDAHPNPLADLELTSISPVLHDLIVHGKVPSWLEPRPAPLYEIVLLGGDPKSSKLLEVIESCTHGDRKSAKALLAHTPCPLVWNLRKYPENFKNTFIIECLRDIEQSGGQAELREMAPNQFRFFIPDR